MEYLKRPGHRLRQSLRLIGIGLLLSIVSCGPQVITGRPPFVSISSMSLEGNGLSAVFDVSNQNGVPMTVRAMELEVTVDDRELLRHSTTLNLLIGANSTEEVRAETRLDDTTRALLNQLEAGEINGLAFDLGGRIDSAEEGGLNFEHTGYLYPVPGRPGRFRSAVTQARELRRDGAL
jgi:LEA14-like dessication related protein